MTEFGPGIDGEVSLAPRAEQQFRLEAERVGSYEIDRDEAVQRSAAASFFANCQLILETVIA